MRRRSSGVVRSGALDLIFATGVAGGAGYALTLFAGVELGPEGYVGFGVFWSSLFFAVSTLNGLQQETARATHPDPRGRGAAVVRDVTAGLASFVFVVTLVSSPLWFPFIFDSSPWWIAVALAFGLAGHTIVTAEIGMLHGIRQTRLIALATGFDALLRLAVVFFALTATHDLGPISLAVVLPYVVLPVLIWVVARGRLQAVTVDTDRWTLTRNVGSTLLAAGASGAMISGISLLIAAAGRAEPAGHLGAIIFAINITRAPLILVVGALQNFIVVRLRDRLDWRGVLVRLVLMVGAAGAVLAAVAAPVGPTVIAHLLNGHKLDPTLSAVIVGSGGLVALMSVTGAAIIARGRHSGNAAGWMVAAASTVVLLFVVPNFDAALPLALILGPSAGLVVHAVAILLDRQLPAGVSPLPVVPEV